MNFIGNTLHLIECTDCFLPRLHLLLPSDHVDIDILTLKSNAMRSDLCQLLFLDKLLVNITHFFDGGIDEVFAAELGASTESSECC